MLNLFKRKKKLSKDEQLLQDYETGKYLQVDNNKDNKEYFSSLQNDQSIKSP